MLSKYTPVIVFYQWISEIASPVAISFIRSIFTLGKAVAAKNILYATAAVLTVPNIQLVAEKMQFVRDRYSIKNVPPAVALILVFITHTRTISNPVAQKRLLMFNSSINNQFAVRTPGWMKNCH